MYRGPKNHIFLYHAYALPFGGYVRDLNRQFTALPAVAASVLPITGGYASASEKRVNFSVPGKYNWGLDGPSSFSLYIGHAYSEVRGTVEDDERPFGAYTTTVRSILDDVRINDDLYIEHSEAILTSMHDNPGNDAVPLEPGVYVGASNMYGVRVRGAKAKLNKHDEIDKEPVYTALQSQVQQTLRAPAGSGGSDTSGWPVNVCNWSNPSELKDGDPEYAKDYAAINRASQNRLRYSIFEDIDLPIIPGVKKFKSSVEVDGFGRVFFGEVIASNAMKQLTMFRINLGCDSCGDAGGSGGTTNGGSMP